MTNKLIISSFLGCKVAIYINSNGYCFSGKCTKGKWVDLNVSTFREAQIKIAKYKNEHSVDNTFEKVTFKKRKNFFKNFLKWFIH